MISIKLNTNRIHHEIDFHDNQSNIICFHPFTARTLPCRHYPAKNYRARLYSARNYRANITALTLTREHYSVKFTAQYLNKLT